MIPTLKPTRPPHYTVKRETDAYGQTLEQFNAYSPPVFPERPYIIESLDGISVLVTPGQKTTYSMDRDGIMVRSDAPATSKKSVAPGARSTVYEGYRPLRDRLHATQFTQAEAFQFAKEQCFVLADNCRAGATATHQLIAI